ncbi:MAG: hypothetical protein LBE59_04255 [Nevskiaceae bacterium]|jgi:hypothetical protein|nr:hypothetical protein [Nevskiaceae bacterium]
MNAEFESPQSDEGGGQWAVQAALAPLLEMNTQCVESLCAMARRPGLWPPLVAGASEVWRALTPTARQRLAAVPWLLVDAGFSRGDPWQGMGYDGVRDGPPLPVSTRWSGAPFFGEQARDFLRRVLVFSWHLSRTDPQLARIALGISPLTAQHLSRLKLAELDALAERYPDALRPRWENSPGLWRMLLAAARQEDGSRITEASLQGFQLMAGRCVSPVSVPPPPPASAGAGAQP